MTKLNEQIKEWLIKHNIHTLSPDKQYLKIIEEVGELARGLLKNDLEAIKDAIGDIYVAVMGWGLQLDVELYGMGCYEGWNDFIIIKEILFILHIEFDKLEYCAFVGLLGALSTNHNLTFKECVSHAYNEIKDREIKIIEGVAVK